MSIVFDEKFREEALRHRMFSDPKSAEIISNLVLLLDAKHTQPKEDAPVSEKNLCPSCRAIDNRSYRDERGMQMRVCGRCMIRWIDEHPTGSPAPVSEEPPLAMQLHHMQLDESTPARVDSPAPHVEDIRYCSDEAQGLPCRHTATEPARVDSPAEGAEQDELLDEEIRHMQRQLESLGTVNDITFSRLAKPSYKRYAAHERERAERLQKKFDDMLKAEHDLSGAYVRLRKILEAFDTPYAPTAEQVWEHTENRAKAMKVELTELRRRVQELPLRCGVTHNPCGSDTWAVGWSCQCAPCQLYLSLLPAPPAGPADGK